MDTSNSLPSNTTPHAGAAPTAQNASGVGSSFLVRRETGHDQDDDDSSDEEVGPLASGRLGLLRDIEPEEANRFEETPHGADAEFDDYPEPPESLVGPIGASTSSQTAAIWNRIDENAPRLHPQPARSAPSQPVISGQPLSLITDGDWNDVDFDQPTVAEGSDARHTSPMLHRPSHPNNLIPTDGWESDHLDSTPTSNPPGASTSQNPPNVTRSSHDNNDNARRMSSSEIAIVPVSTTGVVPSDGWVTLSDTEIPQASSLQSDAEQEQEQEQSTAEEAGFVERSPPASRRASPERDPAPPQPIQNESVQETDADMTDAADARTVEVVLGQQNPDDSGLSPGAAGSLDMDIDPPGVNGASAGVPPISDVALLIERTAEFAESLEKSQTDHHAAMTLICERLHKLEDGRAPRSSSTDEDQPPEPRVSDLAKRRQAQSVKLARAIRSDVLSLFAIDKKAPLPSGPAVELRYPSEEMFRFAWNQRTTSDFNQRAIHVCYQYMIRTRNELRTSVPEKTFLKKIAKHFDHLRERWNLQGNGITRSGDAERLRWRSIYGRKRNMFNRRLKTCLRCPELRRHASLYRALGPLGMSSDEEIVQHNPVDKIKRYRVKRKCWLAPEVAALHDEVDAKSLILSRETFVRGSLPHHRVRDANPPLSTNRAVVKGLPRNVYLKDYLGRLDEYDRQRLQIRETLHPF